MAEAEGARERAEARFEKTQQNAREAAKASAEYEAEGRALRNRTAALRELRMAKEAADQLVADEKKAAKAPVKKRAPKKV
ncbi:hypothetical protein OSH11_00795 [Kaistia dalseonensis]|uniref:Vacuolar-type H+-ATPase subunit E/Vma4 n=1 Tax=Kaistia dalseonensis TaxID=410840 RepID=A0ABU0H0F3_9HYPH|nr:hypothetical protein [Kaistia dalseonensis]MCX5493232.1 hypothetical protein [Kaistia dalseonensis]MDQ0435787.1 vacuolar-type H+-ATPase subunit E/Vma4 [Kaistia dalseonensis]